MPDRAAWLDFQEPYLTALTDLFEGQVESVLDIAENDPLSFDASLTAEETQQIEDALRQATDQTEEQTVTEISEETGTEKESFYQNKEFLLALGVLFVGLVIERAWNRVYTSSATPATDNYPDFPDRKEQVIESAIALGVSDVENVGRKELSQRYSEILRDNYVGRGINNAVWIHSGAENPDLEHLALDGIEFSWDNPPSSTGFPGERFNCTCTAIGVQPNV